MSVFSSKIRKYIYSTLWIVGLGASFGVQVETSAAATPDQELAEEACRDALELNTIEALEEFLLRYPDADTACKALALDALNQFGPGSGGNNGADGAGGNNGGYGG